jgi:hypothetical protein
MLVTMRALVLAVILVSSIAHAQPPGLTEPTAPQFAPKKKSTAMWLTLGTMAAGAGLLAVGEAQQQSGVAILGGAALLVGPSIGHIYADHTWNTGLAVRASGVATFGVGMLAASRCWAYPDISPPSASEQRTCNIGSAAAMVGAIAAVVGTITEVATTPSAVEDYNRAHASFTVAPIQTQNGIAPGVALAGRF